MATTANEETLRKVLQRVFRSDRERFERFCELTRISVPEAHAAVLRGSAITGVRYQDGAPFDYGGPGTSDLDLTLVGAEVLAHFSAFWIPGIHSKPLSDIDPDIAPALTPLRRQLIELVDRPVNIQGTRDWVQFFRGEIMEQPYLLLYGELKQP
jgi:hypothetical protein